MKKRSLSTLGYLLALMFYPIGCVILWRRRRGEKYAYKFLIYGFLGTIGFGGMLTASFLKFGSPQYLALLVGSGMLYLFAGDMQMSLMYRKNQEKPNHPT